MKKLTILFVLITSLAASLNCQNIYVDNNRISFDSIAADQVMSKFEIKDQIIKAYEAEKAISDSVCLSIFNDLSLVNDSLMCERDNAYFREIELKKEVKFYKRFSFGLVLLSALAFFF